MALRWTAAGLLEGPVEAFARASSEMLSRNT